MKLVTITTINGNQILEVTNSEVIFRFTFTTKVTETPERYVLEFWPVKNVPGFTHRIIVNGQAQKMWLSDDFKPTRKAARFFIERFFNEIVFPKA